VRIERGIRVLVTGASRGIGRALAQAFAERGAALGLVARSEDELRELAAALPGEGHEALPADVGDREQIAAAVERFGACDVVVANAGVTEASPFRALDLEHAERMTRINWLGTLYTVKAALPGMLDRARGHVVIVSSGAGYRAFPFSAVYGGTKAAQQVFAEALRHELSGSGVSVTTVFPGRIETHIHEHDKERMPDWYTRGNAEPPEPLAERVVEAVENDARYVYFPANVRALRVVHGISPTLADRMLRAVLGRTAAPRP
jgi:short-subunit dehydrogenase